MFTKNAYGESFRSFYTFYRIERFGLSIPSSQMMLFIFLLAAAVGVLIGGILGDRIGRYRIIWISVLEPLPLTLILPYADPLWTGVLTVMINLIMASDFAAILIYAMDLLPNRIGLIGGLFYGLNFGLGGIAAAILGVLADSYGVETVYRIFSFLPRAGFRISAAARSSRGWLYGIRQVWVGAFKEAHGRCGPNVLSRPTARASRLVFRTVLGPGGLLRRAQGGDPVPQNGISSYRSTNSAFSAMISQP